MNVECIRPFQDVRIPINEHSSLQAYYICDCHHHITYAHRSGRQPQDINGLHIILASLLLTPSTIRLGDRGSSVSKIVRSLD